MDNEPKLSNSNAKEDENQTAGEEGSKQASRPCCSKASNEKEEQAPADKRSDFQFGGAPNGGIALTGVCTPVGNGQDIEACLWRVDRNQPQRKSKYEIIW